MIEYEILNAYSMDHFLRNGLVTGRIESPDLTLLEFFRGIIKHEVNKNRPQLIDDL